MQLFYFLLMMVPIVVIHELGHYWAGRISGIRPEVFSVGFGPELINRTDKHGTKWRIAAIPLGGYVRFAPDLAGTNFPNVDPNAPPYQAPFLGKIFTVFAGPLANFILSFALFFLFAQAVGPQSNEPVIENVNFFETPLQAGDRIIAVEGVSISQMSEFYEEMDKLGREAKVTFARGDEFINAQLPNPNIPIVGAVIPGEPAAHAGLLEGDEIVSIDGVDVNSRQAVIDKVKLGEAVEIEILRAGEKIAVNVTPEMTNDGVPRVGVYFGMIYETRAEGLRGFEAISWAFRATNWVLVESFNGIYDLVTGDVSLEAMSGPVGMSEIAADAASQGFWDFIWLMAMISSAIGFFNLLPIPILDGGHILLMGYERLFGRLPPQIALNFLFMLGICLLLGVLVFVTINEVFG